MATTSPSIKLIRASDGSGNASAATVQNTRSPLATTIQVDTVQGIPDNFYATMGTPHTFTDPVTGETITVISEATAVDFEGHVDGSNLEIDDIAAGYTDNGSAVGDIVVIRPTTPYANNIADVLDVAHNDNGTIKNDAISSQDMFTDPLDPVLRASEIMFDHVASGCVITGDSYGSNRNASMTAGVIYINGKRYVVNAVTARTFTASKDTYIDAPIPASGNTIANADLVYTEVANNAASPALAANRIRLGIVVTGASSIANVGSINQGQENKILPEIGGTEYMTVADSLGNLICPRDPFRRTLAYRQITSNRTNATATVAYATGLRSAIKVPAGRKILVEFFARGAYNSTAGSNFSASLWEGAVNSGTQLAEQYGILSSAAASPGNLRAEYTPSSTDITLTVGFKASTNTAIIDANTGAPAFLRVSLV